jgi:hypothetical protein
VARTVDSCGEEDKEKVFLSSSAPETKKPPPLPRRRRPSESATASKRATAMCTPRAPGVGVGADLE